MLEFTGERVIPGRMSDSRDLQAHYARYLFAMHPWALRKNVLDAACGVGFGSELLATVANKVIGVDISQEAIEYARRYHRPRVTENCQFLIGDVTKIGSNWPTLHNWADLVVSFETIEHLTEPDAFLEQVYLMLRPGGTLLVSAPENSGSKFHVRDYTLGDLADLVSVRFRVDVSYVQDLGFETHIAKGVAAVSEHPTWILRAVKP